MSFPADVDEWMRFALNEHTEDTRSRRDQIYSKVSQVFNEIPYASVNHTLIERLLTDEQVARERQQIGEQAVLQNPLEILWPPKKPKEEVVDVPALETPGDTSPLPSQVADWILFEHRVPFCLAMSLYSVASYSKGGYRLLEATPRIAAWVNDATGQLFIGCRGTNPFKTEFSRDLSDDLFVAMGKFNLLTLDQRPTIFGEAEEMVRRMRAKGYAYDSMMIGGHSLGGLAALYAAHTFNLRACAFNAAAPIINPLTLGPGPTHATHYHIVGDLISTHVSPLAANTVRAYKSDDWGYAAWEHDQGRVLQTDATKALWSADQENRAYYALIVTMKLSPSSEEIARGLEGFLVDIIKSLAKGFPSVKQFLLLLLTLYPVPGSKWWYVADLLDVRQLINKVLQRTPALGSGRAVVGSATAERRQGGRQAVTGSGRPHG